MENDGENMKLQALRAAMQEVIQPWSDFVRTGCILNSLEKI